MNWKRLRSPLPLLGKELVELAAKKNLYHLRMAYAGILFLSFSIAFFEVWTATVKGSPFLLLGRGKPIFDFLIDFQFIGILVFLPGLAADAISRERERGSLLILINVGLSPLEIVLEKFLSRAIAMFSFILLSLPLLAVAYAYGGIAESEIWLAVTFLALACFQAGALSILASVCCRKSPAAFTLSYILTLTVYIVLPALRLILEHLQLLPQGAWSNDFIGSLLPIYLFKANRGGSALDGVLSGMPVLASVALALALAWLILAREAFHQPAAFWSGALDSLDGFFLRLNRWLGGKFLMAESASFPFDKPLVWRELRKRSLLRGRYLLPVFLMVEAPLIAACIDLALGYPATFPGANDAAYFSSLIFIWWGLAAVVLVAEGTGLFHSERSGQTLDLLLAAPLDGEEIVRQKVRGLKPLFIIIGCAYFTLILFEGAAEYMKLGGKGALAFYWISSAAAALLYLPAVFWLNIWTGLRWKSRSWSVYMGFLGTAATLVVPGWFWIGVAWRRWFPSLPAVLLWMISGLFTILLIVFSSFDNGLTVIGLLASPAVVIYWLEFFHDQGAGWELMLCFAVLLNGLAVGGNALYFRGRSLYHADWQLNRP
ncbi:MAG: ABC transporter permease subunit [Planctomycetes bacterium]|nr:ABC transporter permease subunit [Planctomycetota bacterium]